MNWLLICRLLGLLGMLVAGSMVLSLPWAIPLFGEAESFETEGFVGLLGAIVCGLITGGSLYAVGRRDRSPILKKEAIAVVGLGWLLAGFIGSWPYLFSGCLKAPGDPMSFADAMFESISGFSTTGASVLTDLENANLVPRCILFWRSFTHWLGGMGIIVLFVAILGQLGAGGKAMMRREVPGPINESVRPRVRDTALVMWAIYVGISLLLVIVLMIEGMSLYDGLCHSFGTMATGGFSTKNASIKSFDSVTIETTIILFMLIAGTNFSLFYLIIRPSPTLRHGKARVSWKERISPLLRDSEFRLYLCILLGAIGVLTWLLWARGLYSAGDSFRHSAFVSVAIVTTTGFGTENFVEWGESAKGILLMLMFVGGCAGSTGGGIKVIRFLLFAKIIRLEIERAFRPSVVRPLRLGGQVIDDSHRHDVVVYFAIILAVFMIAWLGLLAVEPDTQWQNRPGEKLIDCFSAVASCLNNIGPGLGVLGPAENYSGFADGSKLLLALLMLLGRLELFAILALLVPAFWRTQ